jgi:hypothetical protein
MIVSPIPVINITFSIDHNPFPTFVIDTGIWSEGQRHGKGIMKYSNGDDVYEGDWEIYSYVYEGKWDEKGKKHGKGTMKYFNGDVYEGDWNRDKRQGTGNILVIFMKEIGDMVLIEEQEL